MGSESDQEDKITEDPKFPFLQRKTRIHEERATSENSSTSWQDLNNTLAVIGF